MMEEEDPSATEEESTGRKSFFRTLRDSLREFKNEIGE